MKAEYNGVEYEHKYLARWAIYFDAMGIEFEYRSRYVDLTDTRYALNGLDGRAPDFWLPQVNMLAVAGMGYKRDLCNAIAYKTGLPVLDLWDNPMSQFFEATRYTEPPAGQYKGDVVDSNFVWGKYFVSNYHNYHVDEHRFYSHPATDDAYAEGIMNEEIEAAIDLAQSARFTNNKYDPSIARTQRVSKVRQQKAWENIVDILLPGRRKKESVADRTVVAKGVPKPLETSYRGYRFRSRLEARWAVFFDAMGIEWEYEKEGYDLGDAGWYLPDFWFPKFKFYAEIKPAGVPVSDVDSAKICALGVILLQGDPGNYTSYDYRDAKDEVSHLADLGEWGHCTACGCVRFGYRCAGEFEGTKCNCAGEWSDAFDVHTLRAEKAIEAARSARFEHGETPRIK